MTLRAARKGDAETLFRNYTSDVRSAQFLTRKPHTVIDQTQSFLNTWCKTAWDTASQQFAWVIALQETDEAIGVFLVELEGHRAQIHYGIGYNFWNQGLTAEAGDAVVQWLMMQPQVQRISAVCDLLNEKSMKVLEKLRFQKEGVFRKWLSLPAFGSAARDCYIYARTRESAAIS